MSTDDYWTLAEPGSAQTRVLGSRFLGRALPVSDVVGVNECLDKERKAFHDASHWCWAARLETISGAEERFNDAGEPHGTAGPPILREIQKRGLVGCLVIVTRYFGGTKLGRGGLVRAYGECASLTLDASPRVLRRREAVCRLRCSFDDQSIVYHIAQRFHAVVEPISVSEDISLKLTLLPSALSAIRAALIEESRGRIHIEDVS